ncbi:thiol reductant ABC exporter subunit CydD [Litorivita pollutaquae]|uniref:Thiol reductant ABC exporter subunit CydD n=2 Tax=Litorivita pollutaquae TaxID=2200892 RepID=A0A2V4MLE2_9RHOB|nr:thiol reductant ABC exporter subunit CydD [Litorivita pollutaquae]
MSLMAPGAAMQRRASRLSVLAAVLWPLQAALVAYALGGLLAGVPIPAVPVALAYVALGAVRSFLTVLGDAQSQAAAETVIHAARGHIVLEEARRAADGPFGGAGGVAALASEKLDLLAPFITRYAPARARVMVIPAVILALAFWHSWAVGLVLVISGPLIPVFMALVGMAAKEASQRQLVEIGDLNDLLIERLSALADIRLLGASKVVRDRFATQAKDVQRRTMAVLRVAFLSSTVLELFAAIGVAMVAVYVGFSLLGAIEFGAWGGLTPQSGIFLLLLAPEFYQPLRDLSAAWHDKAAADAVLEEYSTWEAQETTCLLGRGGASLPMRGGAEISLRGCVLPNGDTLHNIEVSAGESVALMGPSGAGKTSALRLMAGLMSPDTGQVRVAGQGLSADTADSWRARVGWMPQSPHFLNASLRENVRMGREGDVSEALKQAAVDEVVARLPHGLHTRLGETGGGLSGGEARRLTLARAIFGAPDVILADEPTADLDAVTAHAVTEGLLAQVARGATLVVATHDPTLAARMDRVIEVGEAR